MKRVDPVLFAPLGVKPRAVVVLTTRGITERAERWVEKFGTRVTSRDSSEKTRAEKIRVVDEITIERRITETEGVVAVAESVQVVEDKGGRGKSRVASLFVAGGLVEIKERVTGQRRVDKRRRETRQ